MPTVMTAVQWLSRRAKDILVLLLATMFVTFVLQIVFRYLINEPLGWSEEVIVGVWLWTVLWGAAFVLRESEEIRFDIIYSNISERARRIFTVITGVVLMAVYGLSLPAAYSYVTFMKVERSAYLHIRMDVLYSIYVIFAVASIARYAYLVWHALRGDTVTPQTNPSELGD
ncbi:C4-dicarboxylate ABC transporter permease [Pseudolabrys sp. Root1462]|uniref:TRAP transporter small permease n=1 Tax=Pseudolabrys sp. Root1462 TaxID=1736466 RepID=UPI000702A086|nr:TRAP transporter small permease subunit [Pseudolabrys sp. Root1462]KQY99703.1 C4-dicarboxylate ABC transporter permease [Pseudolabrys sp. Root1462]